MKLSDIDKVLLRYADSRSPAELSLITGGMLTPEECAARVSMLLEQGDWLTRTQQDALVTMKMRMLISEMEDQPRTTRNAEVLIRALEVLGNRLDKRAAATEQDLQRLYSWQGELLIDAIVNVLTHMRRRLPDVAAIPEHEWRQVVDEGIRRAGALFASHESTDDGVPVITSATKPHGTLREPAGLPSAQDASASATAHRSATAATPPSTS